MLRVLKITPESNSGLSMRNLKRHRCQRAVPRHNARGDHRTGKWPSHELKKKNSNAHGCTMPISKVGYTCIRLWDISMKKISGACPNP